MCGLLQKIYTVLKKWSKRQLYDVYLEPLKKEENLIKLRNVLWLRFLLFDKDKKNTHSIFLPCTHTYTHVKGTQPKKWAEIRMLRHLCRLDGSSQWVLKYSERGFSQYVCFHEIQ